MDSFTLRIIATPFILNLSVFLFSLVGNSIASASDGHCSSSMPDHAAMSDIVLVKGGCFEMGDVSNDGFDDEKPVHEVCLDDYFMDRCEVTQKQYYSVTGSNPSSFGGCDDCPVESVTWDEARAYCEQVGKRLPSEAEWEYAARSGGKIEKWSGTSVETAADFVSRGKSLASFGWFRGNSVKRTNPVAKKKPNQLGLYDMTGNVWEWVGDWYSRDYYKESPIKNPSGPDSGVYRIVRGGSWAHEAIHIRNYARLRVLSGNRNHTYGFRCGK